MGRAVEFGGAGRSSLGCAGWGGVDCDGGWVGWGRVGSGRVG